MKEIKYHFAYDENNLLVSIDNLEKEEALRHSYHCITCGDEMEACIGTHNRPYFRHKQTNNACNPESYVHKLAKLRIKELFNNHSKQFCIQFVRDITCSLKDQCGFYEDYECKGFCELDPIDLHKFYDTCLEEQHVDGYIADLLLSDSMGKIKSPIAIEIWHEHKSTQSKIESGIKIIEIRVKKEEDIDKFTTDLLREHDVDFYNFNPKHKLDCGQIIRFEYFRSGSAYVNNLDEIIFCDKLHTKINPKSMIELNVPVGYLSYPNTYHAGLVYLLDKGMDIRNCMLCRYYHGYESINEAPMCGLYKRFDTPVYPKQKEALTCQYFKFNDKLLADTREVLRTSKITEV